MIEAIVRGLCAANDFRTESLGDCRHRITTIGEIPWEVHALDGVVRLRRSDAATLTVTALDQFGQPTDTIISCETTHCVLSSLE